MQEIPDDGGYSCGWGNCADPEYMHYYLKNNKPIEAPEPIQIKSSTWSPFPNFFMSAGGDIAKNPYGEFIEGILPFGEFYSNGGQIVDALKFVENYGRPVYKQVKGSLPGGPVLEFFLGGGLQFTADVNNHNQVRPLPLILVRAGIVGVEDGITESISTPTGVLIGSAGAVCGPLAPVCMIGGYLAGANGVTWAMDNITWQPINQAFDFYRK